MTESERLARLEKALAHGGGTHTIADVVALIKDGKAQFWQHGEGCVITEIHDYPLRKMLHYWLVFGELQPCLDLQPEIDAWAAREGCTAATSTGRKGWGRALAPSGWRPWLPSYIKPLDRERMQ